MSSMYSLFLFLHFLLLPFSSSAQKKLETFERLFGPFNSSYYSTFAVLPPATISNGALQVTPDSAGNFTLTNRSGRIFFNQTFKLWENANSNPQSQSQSQTVSFNTSFLINIFRNNNQSHPGEGFSFLIAPDLTIPIASHGQYLGLTNSSTDGLSTNQIVALELDTFKQDFDPDDNHMGLNINSVHSIKTVPLSTHNIQISPVSARFYVVWIQYNGVKKLIDVYMVEQPGKESPTPSKPSKPLITSDLDLKTIVNQNSYFGFAASTGSENTQLNCVLKWNLTIEMFPVKDDDKKTGLKIGLGIGVSVVILFVLAGGIGGLVYYRKRKERSGPSILMGALKSLPGTPREFRFRDLKKATNNFDDKYKLGQGGFGVVYKGLLPNENLEIAVKKFSRDNIKGRDDFLAELTIINRLRHKHLVRLLGWCHENGRLLLVYDYMPNGSLDDHLFSDTEEIKSTTLEWKSRYKIITGVVSALHYLHNEYDQKVVHRDLKASNIMLDSDFNARLGDFGLARALENEKTSYAELEGVPGTMGYIAPECFHTGKATCESDVYGFGAVLLEVVCGQRPWTKIEGFQFLVDWIWCLHREGRILEAVDKRLDKDYDIEEATRLLLLGLACSHPIAGERPKTNVILQIISGSVAAPPVPPFKPAFVWPSSMPGPNSFNITNSSIINTTDTTPITSGWTPHFDDQESYKGDSYSSNLV